MRFTCFTSGTSASLLWFTLGMALENVSMEENGKKTSQTEIVQVSGYRFLFTHGPLVGSHCAVLHTITERLIER